MMDVVNTAKGKVRIEFLDETLVDITEHSRLLIDDFVYDPATGNFTSSSTVASGTGSSTDVDALFYTYAVADDTDTTATEGLIIIGLGAQADSAILNGVITFA